MVGGKTVISGGMVSMTGMVRGFLLVAEDFREITPWITAMLRDGGRLAGGAAETVNSNSWPGTLVLRTAEKALVVLCGSERVSGISIRLKILSTWVVGLVELELEIEIGPFGRDFDGHPDNAADLKDHIGACAVVGSHGDGPDSCPRSCRGATSTGIRQTWPGAIFCTVQVFLAEPSPTTVQLHEPMTLLISRVSSPVLVATKV